MNRLQKCILWMHCIPFHHFHKDIRQSNLLNFWELDIVRSSCEPGFIFHVEGNKIESVDVRTSTHTYKCSPVCESQPRLKLVPVTGQLSPGVTGDLSCPLLIIWQHIFYLSPTALPQVSRGVWLVERFCDARRAVIGVSCANEAGGGRLSEEAR